MKAKVRARVENSSTVPIRAFTAEHVLTFENTDNVFGRALKFRQEFRKLYGNDIDLTLLSVEWL